ncbi:MAG: hypothetical protein WBD37_05835 [Anderseniella sp.]
MSGNLNDRPFLLLFMRILRIMLWCCIGSLLLVGGAIWFSISKGFTDASQQPLTFIAILIALSLAILFAVSRMLKQAEVAEKASKAR